MTEVSLWVIAPAQTACGVTSADFWSNVVCAAKVLCRVIRGLTALFVHLTVETKLGAWIIHTAMATACIVTVATARNNRIVTTEGFLEVVGVSSALFVDFISVAEVGAWIVALNSTALALLCSVLRTHHSTATYEVIGIVNMFVAFGDNDTLMTEASGRVVSFSGTAPSV